MKNIFTFVLFFMKYDDGALFIHPIIIHLQLADLTVELSGFLQRENQGTDVIHLVFTFIEPTFLDRQIIFQLVVDYNAVCLLSPEIVSFTFCPTGR